MTIIISGPKPKINKREKNIKKKKWEKNYTKKSFFV